MQRLVNIFIVIFIFSVPWQDMVKLPGMGTLSRLTGLLAFAAGIGAIVMTNRVRPLKTIHLWAGLFTLWVSMTYFWSVWPEKTEEFAFSMLQLLLFNLLMWQFVRTREDIQEALQSLVLGGYVLIFFTLQAWLSGEQHSYNRYTAEGVNENELAAMLGLGVPIALYLLMGSRHWLLRIINILYIPAAFTAITLAASRTGFIVASAGFLYAIVVLRRTPLFWRTISIAFLLAAVIAALPLIPQTSIDRLATIEQEASSGTLTGRTTIWKYGMLAWQEHPVLGNGLGSFRKVVNPFSISESAHNSFISLLVETGIIGLLIFISFLLFLFKLMPQVPQQDRSFQIALMGCLLLAQMSTEWSMEKIAWVLYSLLISHAWLESNQTIHWRIKPTTNLTAGAKAAHA